jgi:hypothetical protein
MEPNHPEVGRELLASQLLPRTIVVLGRDEDPVLLTTWVHRVGQDFVSFRMGDINITLVAMRQPDDTLRDDRGQRIRVWEFLEHGRETTIQ